MIAAVRAAVDVPLIASGGAGRAEDFPPAVAAGADAVLASSVFHYGSVRIAEVKAALAAAGFPVRGQDTPISSAERAKEKRNRTDDPDPGQRRRDPTGEHDRPGLHLLQDHHR
jgi:NAD(P)H-dependent flavin oxidoreductase YrpB (nitropropane dioxygenase family)